MMESANKDRKDKKLLHFHFCGTGERVANVAQHLVNEGEYSHLIENQKQLYQEKNQLENDGKKLMEKWESLQTLKNLNSTKKHKQRKKTERGGFEDAFKAVEKIKLPQLELNESELSKMIEENKKNIEDNKLKREDIINLFNAIENSNHSYVKYLYPESLLNHTTRLVRGVES